ncbi:hypothetical protein MLD38_022262 [Melastoma candidum]|uniref:Uncharacterized protein n=1 Tax=Melastoma candidum TaxID=119954 RepID=A0ACB9QHV8_9MYRT|nr:hypothetical protein MLD38_022262 [Melastoma candidum]
MAYTQIGSVQFWYYLGADGRVCSEVLLLLIVGRQGVEVLTIDNAHVMLLFSTAWYLYIWSESLFVEKLALGKWLHESGIYWVSKLHLPSSYGVRLELLCQG